MAIEKLIEFAKNGNKNTDNLNLDTGFPVNLKPARQWFNWLFNDLTLKVNEVIDGKLDRAANAVSASKLEIVRTISFSGAATGSFNFDGSANTSCLITLANSGVVEGTYSSTIQIPTISVNAKGQITAISQQAIRSASTTQTGVVQLVNDLLTNDSTKALTAAQGKVLQDTKLDKAGGTATGDIKAPSFTGTLNGGNQTKSSTMTTDFAFLNEVTASGTSSFFYDNGSGKFFSPYTTGIVSNLIDGSYFIMGMAPTDTKVKVMNGVRRPDGSYQYLKNITLTDVNSINSMTDAGSFIWDTHKSGGWATGNLFKATPNTTKQAMQGAYGQADTCERIFMTINSTSPWEVGNGNGIWIDINGTYTSGAWRFANAVTFDEKITGSIDKAVSLISSDNRAIKPIDIPSGVMSYFTSSGGLNSGVGNASYGDFLTFNTYGDQSGGNKNGLFLGKNGQGIHHYNAPYGAGNWGASRRLAYTDNETFTGVVSAGGFSCTSSEAVLRNNAGRYLFVNAGNWGCYDPNIGNIPLPESNGGTGNGIGMASSAGRLAFPRAINGVTFDGTKDISLPIPGYGRYSINVLGSRALETTYTNSSGSAIFVTVAILGSSGKPAAVTINGVLIVAAAESVTRMYSIAVMHGDSYRFDGSYVSAWLETR
ncbi:hypothetical protein [Acinetobacter sp. ANC 4648]|uniref:hypothetical protein n=1 Tax=Acinetobacter sp. ANC 4648 TaxID=1977875 RepID=UPI000A34177E|nr:hypothetical protein [Acinetobacter sp. ANC 4648]OTG82338.1 hypothetical protein B9T27_08875 [Acinetobacter sp. ANC 4648]